MILAPKYSHSSISLRWLFIAQNQITSPHGMKNFTSGEQIYRPAIFRTSGGKRKFRAYAESNSESFYVKIEKREQIFRKKNLAVISIDI